MRQSSKTASYICRNGRACRSFFSKNDFHNLLCLFVIGRTQIPELHKQPLLRQSDRPWKAWSEPGSTELQIMPFQGGTGLITTIVLPPQPTCPFSSGPVCLAPLEAGHLISSWRFAGYAQLASYLIGHFQMRFGSRENFLSHITCFVV